MSKITKSSKTGKTFNKMLFKDLNLQNDYLRILQKKRLVGFERTFLEIESWMRRERTAMKNKPLILIFEDTHDHSLLLSKYLEYSKTVTTQRDENINIRVITTKNFGFKDNAACLYKIMTLLQEKLNLRQRIPFTKNKLRRSFENYLKIASDKLKKTAIFDSVINIFIENVDLQSEGELENRKNSKVKYWLPEQIPEKVNLVFTCQKNSICKNFFKMSNFPFIEVYGEKMKKKVFENLMKNLKNHECFSDHNSAVFEIIEGMEIDSEESNSVEFLEKIYLFFFERKNYRNEKKLQIVNKIIQKMWNPEKINGVKKLDQIIDLGFERLAKVMSIIPPVFTITKTNLFEYLIYLYLPTTGLTLSELSKLTFLTPQKLEILNLFFQNSLISSPPYIKLIDSTLINHILPKIPHEKILISFKKISEALDSSPLSNRKIKERLNCSYIIQDYFTMKAILGDIENFLIFYNRDNKLSLFKYWSGLLKKCYDPVIEYNKSVELFEMQYKPNSEDLFKLIVQLSRFFIDLADFEESEIPEFRRPKIINRVKALKMNYDGLNNEDKEKVEAEEKMVGWKEEDIGSLSDSNYFVRNQKKLNTSDFEYSDAESDIVEHRKGTIVNYLQEIGMLREVKKFNLYQKNNKALEKILTEDETQNVGVQSGFNVYYNNLKFLIKERKSTTIAQKQIQKELNEPAYLFSSPETSRSSDDPKKNHPGLYNIITKIVKREADKQKYKIGREIDLTIKPHNQKKYYYYKRWLWMMFPWACLSHKNEFIYSNFMKICYSDNDKGIRFKEEKKLVEDSMAIIMESKIQKKDILYSEARSRRIYGSYNRSGKSLSFSRRRGKFDRDRLSVSGLGRDGRRKGFLLSKTSLYKNNLSLTHGKISQNQTNEEPSHLFLPLESETKPNFFLTSVKNSKILKKKNEQKERRKKNMEIIKKSADLGTVKKRFKNQMDKSFYLSNHDLMISKKFNSKIYNDRINQQFIKGLRNESFNGMLKNIRQAIQEKGRMEIKVIEKKNNSLITALNKILFESNKNEIFLEKLKKQYDELDIEIFDDTEKNLNSIESIEKKITEAEIGIEESEKIERRLKMIIEICERNKTLNEEWINHLNFYISNLEKMRQQLLKQMRQSDKHMYQFRILEGQIIEQNRKKLKNQSMIINSFNTEIRNQKKIDNIFKDIEMVKPTIDDYGSEMASVGLSLFNTKHSGSKFVSTTKQRMINEERRRQIQQMKGWVRKILRGFGFEEGRFGGDRVKEILRSDKFRDFIDKISKRNQKEYELKQSRMRLIELQQHKINLQNKREYFEFMKGEKRYAESRRQLAQLQFFIQKNQRVESRVKQKLQKLTYLQKIQLTNISFMNSLIRKLGLKRQRDLILNAYEGFEVDSFRVELFSLKNKCQNMVGEKKFKQVLEGKGRVEEVMVDLGIDLQVYKRRTFRLKTKNGSGIYNSLDDFDIPMDTIDGEGWPARPTSGSK